MVVFFLNLHSSHHPPATAVANILGQKIKYFKSIEQIASSLGFEQILPLAARTNSAIDKSASPITPPSSGHPSRVPDTSLLIEPKPIHPPRAITPELVPDSMGSRIAEPRLSEAMAFAPEEVGFDRMGSRVGKVEG
jgi:glucosamine-6-phosphate deaminase